MNPLARLRWRLRTPKPVGSPHTRLGLKLGWELSDRVDKTSRFLKTACGFQNSPELRRAVWTIELAVFLYATRTSSPTARDEFLAALRETAEIEIAASRGLQVADGERIFTDASYLAERIHRAIDGGSQSPAEIPGELGKVLDRWLVDSGLPASPVTELVLGTRFAVTLLAAPRLLRSAADNDGT